MANAKADPIRPWFIAAEEVGEYIGIRFGHLPPGKTEPEWIFLRHADFDGIGGFAVILRERGFDLQSLPQIRHPANPSLVSRARLLGKLLRPQRRLQWGPLERGLHLGPPPQPPPAVAWHIFSEETTLHIRRACRKTQVTVNSFLLKTLTKAIRPFLKDHSSEVPWMIPVNLRGKVCRSREEENHSSYVGVRVKSFETAVDVHRNIYAALNRGEHWSNWWGYRLGKFLSAGMRRQLVATGRCMSQWSIGSFSNLGDWDPERKNVGLASDGGWLFSPPVLRCQLLGTGVVTFHNRLSLTIQAHPDLTTEPAVPRCWVQNWVKEIEMDLASVLTGPIVTHSVTIPVVAA